MHTAFGRALRMRRLYRHGDERLLVVPLDHPINEGPVTGGGRRLDALVGQVAEGGADAIVLHKGGLRFVDPGRFAELALIVHLSASTVRSTDPDAKYLVADVAEALRLGADAVSVHVNLGSREEARQLADLGAVADACDRLNTPLLAMIYPRGPAVTDPRDPELIAHAVAVAADLGADLVKTTAPADSAELADITATAGIPVLVAGGPPRADALSTVAEWLLAGAAGVAMGRNIFRARDVTEATRRVAEIVHTNHIHPLSLTA